MPPETDAVQAHEARITILEQQAADVRATLKELTNDVRQLVAVMTQQAEDRAALKRAFQQIGRLADKVEALEASLQAAKEDELRQEAQRANDELQQFRANRRRVLWMALSYALAGAAGSLFTHLGIPMVTR